VRGKVLLSLLFGVVVVSGLVVYADASDMAGALRRFRWEFLPAIVALTLLNYLLRFLKWQYYLRQIGVRDLPARDSLLIFFSGLSMVITPGKVGEWLKCYLLGQACGTPFARSAPIVVAERLTDGLALVLLASGGLLLFGRGWQIMALALLLAAAVVLAARHRGLAGRIVRLAGRLPFLSKRTHAVVAFYESSRTLFSPGNLAIAVAIGFVSWAGECLAFFLVLVGLGEDASALLAVKAAFILSASTLGASLVLLPGGLGFAEGGITGLCQVLLDMTRSAAVAAALLIRLCTLWFGVGLGALMLAVTLRRLRTPVKAAEAAPQDAASA